MSHPDISTLQTQCNIAEKSRSEIDRIEFVDTTATLFVMMHEALSSWYLDIWMTLIDRIEFVVSRYVEDSQTQRIIYIYLNITTSINHRTHCNTLQHTATHCNMNASCLCTRTWWYGCATHCNTLQRTATHCNTLQHTATLTTLPLRTYIWRNGVENCNTHCNTLHRIATHCNTLQHTATHCNNNDRALVHARLCRRSATHCIVLQHTTTHCNNNDLALAHARLCATQRARISSKGNGNFRVVVFVACDCVGALERCMKHQNQ